MKFPSLRVSSFHRGVVAEKPSEELFTIDTTGSEEIRKSYLKRHKPLKSDEIIAQRSAIPAVDSRKRTNSKVTDGVIEPKTKRHKSDYISHKEWLRLKQVARAGNPDAKKEGDDIYDPWADTEEAPTYEDPKFDFLPKPKSKVAPPTIKKAPIALTANGKPVPAVKKPEAGVSYNPSFEDWDKLLAEEGQRAVEAEKKRLEDEQRWQERQRLRAEAEAQGDDGEVKSDDESAWEGFESEYEKPEWLNKKRPERKTQAQRNKIKRRKEAERKAKWEEQMKKRQQQAEQVNDIAKTIEEREEERRRRQEQEGESTDEGDDRKLRRRPLGKNP